MTGLIAFIEQLIADLAALFGKNAKAGKPKVACCDCSTIRAYSIPVETLQQCAENGLSIQDVLKQAVDSNAAAAAKCP